MTCTIVAHAYDHYLVYLDGERQSGGFTCHEGVWTYDPDDAYYVSFTSTQLQALADKLLELNIGQSPKPLT